MHAYRASSECSASAARQLHPRRHRQTRRWWRELCAALKTLGALSLLGDAIRAQPVDPDRSSSLRGTGFLPAPNQCEPSSDTAAAESGTGERDSSRHAAGLWKMQKGHRFFDGYQFNASGCRCGLAPAWNLLVVMVRHPGDKDGGAGPQGLWWQLRNRRPGNLSEANPGGGRRGDP